MLPEVASKMAICTNGLLEPLGDAGKSLAVTLPAPRVIESSINRTALTIVFVHNIVFILNLL